MHNRGIAIIGTIIWIILLMQLKKFIALLILLTNDPKPFIINKEEGIVHFVRGFNQCFPLVRGGGYCSFVFMVNINIFCWMGGGVGIVWNGAC